MEFLHACAKKKDLKPATRGPPLPEKKEGRQKKGSRSVARFGLAADDTKQQNCQPPALNEARAAAEEKRRKEGKKGNNNGPLRDSNSRPPPPKGGIMPLDQTDDCLKVKIYNIKTLYVKEKIVMLEMSRRHACQPPPLWVTYCTSAAT